MPITATFLMSLVASLFAVGAMRKVATRLRIGAFPTARKIHSGFKPLLGGVGVFVGLILGVGFANILDDISFKSWIAQSLHFWTGLLIILLLGLIDDIRGMNALQKFAAQFFAAGVAVEGGCCIDAFYGPMGGTLELGWFSVPFSILWIMFIINAVNLLDGLDGLAGGISLITITGFLIIAIMNGDSFLMVLAVAFIGALLGFLTYNYHPASIFMGDVGSLMLGYVLAYFSVESLKVANSHQVYFLASLVLLGMPVNDTLISFFRRMGRGDHPFKADREHIHHRVLKLGVSHLDTVWLMYYFTLLYVGLGILMVLYREIVGLLLFVVAFVFSLFWAWRLGYLETRQVISFGVQEQETLASIRPLINVNRIWSRILIFGGDIAAIGLALYLTFWFRFHSGILETSPPGIPAGDFLAEPVLLIFVGFWVLLFWLNGLYRMPWDVSRFDKSLRVMKVITFGSLFLLVLLNLDLLISTTSKPLLNQPQMYTLAFFWIMMIGCVNGIRLGIIYVEKRYHLFEYTYKNTLLIGTTRKARNIVRDIQKNPHLLNRLVGVLERKTTRREFEGLPVLGEYRDLGPLIQAHKIEEIIVAISETAREDLLNIIGICDRLQVVVKTLPVLREIVSGRKPELAGHALIRVFPEKMVLWQWLVKRLFDIFFAVTLGILFIPFWSTLAVIIKSKFRKNVLVKIPILGKNGRIFNMYLFRMGQASRLSDSVYQGAAGAQKLPPLGDFLYRTRLYKFPQLFNILRGDMSVVGPRPETPEWYRIHQQRLRFLHRRLLVRSGITGISQIRYRYDESQKFIQERFKYDIYYVENISLNLDLRIILRSVMLLFRRPGHDIE